MEKFNETLFEMLSKAGSDITLADINRANLPRDKQVFTNSYGITDEHLFLEIVDRFFFEEVFLTGNDLERVEDASRGVYAYGCGPATWEFNLESNEFEMGYISMYALDNYLGVVEGA